MKKPVLINILMCVIAVMLFSGCYDADLILDDVLDYSNWRDDVVFYSHEIEYYGHSKYKKIDSAHKEAFNSAFEDIEIFGAKLCMPMKVSELPDKFELYYDVLMVPAAMWPDWFIRYGDEIDDINESGLIVVSKYGAPEETSLVKGLKEYSLLLFYDDIEIANAWVICKEGQSVEDGIIYKINGIFSEQPVLLGGKVDISSDIGEIKEFLGDGNEFLSSHSGDYLDLIYTDGDRAIRLEYSVNGEDINFIHGYIETIERYK